MHRLHGVRVSYSNNDLDGLNQSDIELMDGSVVSDPVFIVPTCHGTLTPV
jgi:hypothetical protein